MSSVTDICNLALAHLGDEANVVSITPPDGTVQAQHCARFYPMARDAVLQAFPWTFATRRIALSSVVNPTSDDWRYAYALPNQFLRPLQAMVPGVPAMNFGAGDTDTGSFPYLVESAEDGSLLLYTNQEMTSLRYTARVSDTTKFPPLVVIAISRLLAAWLAGPILKGDTGIKVSQAQLKWFELEMGKATQADASIGRRDLSHYRAEWIRARAYMGPDDYRSRYHL